MLLTRLSFIEVFLKAAFKFSPIFFAQIFRIFFLIYVKTYAELNIAELFSFHKPSQIIQNLLTLRMQRDRYTYELVWSPWSMHHLVDLEVSWQIRIFNDPRVSCRISRNTKTRTLLNEIRNQSRLKSESERLNIKRIINYFMCVKRLMSLKMLNWIVSVLSLKPYWFLEGWFVTVSMFVDWRLTWTRTSGKLTFMANSSRE